MRNLIPKSINKSKLTIWRNVSLVDILIIIAWFSLSGLFVFGLPMKDWQKILAIFLLAIFAFPLIVSVQPGIKGWNALILLFRHWSMPKKYQKDSRNDTRLLVPYDCVVGQHFIATQKINGRTNLVGCLSVSGFDLTLLTPAEQELRLKDFQDALKFSNFPITFLKLEKPLEFNQTIKYYQEQLAKITKAFNNQELSQTGFLARNKQIKAMISSLEKDLVVTSSGVRTKKCFYIFVYGQNEEHLLDNLNLLENKLVSSNFICRLLTNYELVQNLHLIWNPYAKPLTKKEFHQHKDSLNEILSFQDFKLNKTFFLANQVHYAINGIYDYPLLVSDLWGAILACSEQTIIWNINPLDHQAMKKSLNKAINNAYTKQFMTKSHINRSENNYEIEAYQQQLVEEINGANEIIKNVDILFLSYGTTLKVLKQSQTRLKKSLQELDMKINSLIYQQLEGYNAFLPKNYDPLMMKIGREIPCATIAASFPFMSGGLSDEKGLYLGQNNIGDPILFDAFKLNNNRKNHNQIIIGTSGSGKSFATKKMIAFHLNVGRTVIVIDPEREYQNLTRYYDGQWIDTGDASLGRINPLQVLDNNFKEVSEFKIIDNTIEGQMDEQNAAPVSNHLRLLTQWFKTLYPDFNDRELNLLVKYFKQLYQEWKITNQTGVEQLNSNQFPTMSDFYHLLVRENKNNSSLLLKEFIDVVATDFLNDGKYEKLWNGHTTLVFNNQFVVYDVLTLFEQDEPKVTAAQLHLVLAVIKAEVKHNRFKTENEIVIIVDEAHLAIDKDNPATLNFMYQMVKRIRKYHGAIIITTQNLNDFTGSEEIKKKTTAMINNTQYSLILNLAPQDLKDVAELYRSYGGLTLTQRDYIARAGKGQALFVVSGYERHCIHIQATLKEQESF